MYVADKTPRFDLVKTTHKVLKETRFECYKCGLPWMKGWDICPECGSEDWTDRKRRKYTVREESY